MDKSNCKYEMAKSASGFFKADGAETFQTKKAPINPMKGDSDMRTSDQTSKVDKISRHHNKPNSELGGTDTGSIGKGYAVGNVLQAYSKAYGRYPNDDDEEALTGGLHPKNVIYS